MDAAYRTSRSLRVLALVCVTVMLSGCPSSNFQIKNLVKSDVDMVADTHIRELRSLTHELLIKLYKRNPNQLTRGRGGSVTRRINQLFSLPTNYRFDELGNRRGNDALHLAFDPTFEGDRVFALMVGINSMLHGSYGSNHELFMLDKLDPQKLHLSARNLEIINWRLSSRLDPSGQPLLLSNGYEEGIANLSFERLFGKMIVLQDMMAKIVAGRTNRTINSVVHSVASTTLFPIGI